MTKLLLEQKLSKLRQDLLFKARLIEVTCFLFKSVFFNLFGVTVPSGPGPHHHRGFTITFRHVTFGRTPLDTDAETLYLTTHNTHKRQTSMPPVRFEPTIPASERPQTHSLHRVATGIGIPTTYKPESTRVTFGT
jgi:hypothetical protein